LDAAAVEESVTGDKEGVGALARRCSDGLISLGSGFATQIIEIEER
jgi:hypothetical protein